MQKIHEEDGLPALLGSPMRRHFVHDVEKNSLGMPSGLTLAEMNASKWAVPERPSRVAKTKRSKAKPQPSAAEQTSPATTPKLQITNEIPHGPAFEALQQRIEALPYRQAGKA